MPSETAPTARSGRARGLVALLPPLVALVAQQLLWPYLQPYVWFFFFPAVFVSSWIGGVGGGLAATLLSTFLVVFFFIAPGSSLAVADLHTLLPVGMFVVMGVLFSLFHGRLRRATAAGATTLRALNAANENLEQRVRERTAELERINAALRESEELFSKAFRLGPDCVVIVRAADRTVISANEAVCRLWGRSAEELVGQPTVGLVRWELEEQRLAFTRMLEERGECLSYEATLRLADGPPMIFSLSARLITLRGEACVLSVMRDITDLRRVETAAAVIIESSDDAIVGKNIDGVITSWNPGAERIFGYTAGEMVGTSIRRIIPAERLDEEVRIMAQIARGERVRHFETVRRRKDGRPVDISVTISPIKNGAGQVVGASKIARDISESKRAEAALRLEHERFDATAASSPGVLYSLRQRPDGTRCFPYVSPGIESLVGLRPDELVADGAPLFNLILPADRMEMKLEADESARTLAPFHREWRMLHPERGEIWIEGNSVPTREADGGTLWHGVMTDITGRKQAEAAIHRLNATLEQRVAERTAELSDLYNHAPCGYHSLDAAGLIVRMNDTELNWLGRTRDEVVGKRRIVEFLTPPSVEIFAQKFPVLKDRGVLSDLEIEFVRKDGSIFPALVNATKVTDAEGNLLVTRATVVNYTERKRVERQLLESQAHLEAANRELEAFSYSVSHDLRAPLRAINGFSRIMLEDFGAGLPAEGRRYLDQICGGAQQMGALIDDLLTFSRLGRLEMSKRLVNFDDLVREVLADLTVQQAGRQIDVRIGELPDGSGDRALLKQVWANLLSNALKYSRNRPNPVVEIGCERRDGEDVYFVRDNGAGFDMRYAGKLFGVFQRLHRAEDYEGTGVGLAIVQRVIHRHGGRVWAEAAVDRGATFYFTLKQESPT